MVPHAPETRLATHEVANQPPDFADIDLFGADAALREAVAREGGEWLEAPLSALGREAGTAEVLALGEAANANPPQLASFDRRGRRIDEVRFHPAWHTLMALAMRHRIHDFAWTAGRPGGHVGHAALLAVFTQAEAGTMCPMSMTHASVPVLRRQPDIGQPWLDRLLGGAYDAPLRPIAEKRGITLGMAMTEKQGGSDIRANATAAHPLGAGGPGGEYRLVGHKWFCSAPMSDGFLTLAQAPGGLSCFLLPRIRPDGSRNTIQLMRLKEKLGNRSNASAEIEYHDAFAWMVGPEGRGVQTIIEMVHGTRLDAAAATLGVMRMALAQATHHVRHRRAFQRNLIDQPAMRAVVADLQLDYEAGAALVMRVARAFDDTAEEGRAFARLAVALAKYQLTRIVIAFTGECMECLGGAGYVEESGMPRLYREAPVNGIWEGSGNVIALDVLRTLAREPAALEGLRAELALARGANTFFDSACEDLPDLVAAALRDESQARLLCERLALVLQASLLLRHAPAAVADAFCAARLAGTGTRSYGALPPGADAPAVAARVLPE
jgi:putative acyl-CoA dehydrogenase